MILDPCGWGSARTVDILAVLDSVRTVFRPCFGSSLNQQKLTIVHGSDCPRTLRSINVIVLAVQNKYWAQYAYQFSHEYCHFQIYENVPQQMRWFEESLCELASYFFLPRIAKLWQVSPPYPNWISYAPNFISYVNDDMRKATAFNLDFSSNTETLRYLASNEYDRAKNAYVAIALAQIFHETPTLWSTIHYIAKIEDGLSFDESLHCWHDQSPIEYQQSIKKIAQIFSIDI